ncbi:MAG: response regulator [Rubrivivax sp.]
MEAWAHPYRHLHPLAGSRQHPEPAACFLDIGLPDMDGYEIARWLRDAEEGKDLFLVATTGWGQPVHKCRALAAGFDIHLTKPVDLVEASRLLAARLLAASAVSDQRLSVLPASKPGSSDSALGMGEG